MTAQACKHQTQNRGNDPGVVTKSSMHAEGNVASSEINAMDVDDTVEDTTNPPPVTGEGRGQCTWAKDTWRLCCRRGNFADRQCDTTQDMWRLKLRCLAWSCTPVNVAASISAYSLVMPLACWAQRLRQSAHLPRAASVLPIAIAIGVFLLLNSVNFDRFTHHTTEIRRQALVLLGGCYMAFFGCVCLVFWQPGTPTEQFCYNYECTSVVCTTIAATLLRFAAPMIAWGFQNQYTIANPGGPPLGPNTLQAISSSIFAAFLFIVGVATYGIVEAGAPHGGHYGAVAAAQHVTLAPPSFCVFLASLSPRAQTITPCKSWADFMPTFVYGCGILWPWALWVVGWLPAAVACTSAIAAVCVVSAFRLGAVTLVSLGQAPPPSHADDTWI